MEQVTITRREWERRIKGRTAIVTYDTAGNGQRKILQMTAQGTVLRPVTVLGMRAVRKARS